MARNPLRIPSAIRSRIDMEKLEDDVCIGDTVCLMSEETGGFVYSYQSSYVNNEIAVASRDNDEKRNDPKKPKVQTGEALYFSITAQNRYKANKRWLKARKMHDRDLQNPTVKRQLAQSKRAALAESEDNNREQRRQEGKTIYYGQIVQLRHNFTNKFIHVNTTRTSWTESSNLMVELLPENGKRAQFKVLPRYKVKAEGDMVQVGDHVMFESVKSPGQFLHTSHMIYDEKDDTVYADSHELNLSVTGTGFSLFRARAINADVDIKNVATGCCIVRLFHKEIEAYLAAEGVNGDQKMDSENAHLRMRPVTSTNHKSLSPPTNAITCWIMEKEISCIDGSGIGYEEQIRFQHFTTQQFLIMDTKLQIGLTKDRENPYTVFRLHAATKQTDYVMHKAYVRIQHVLTGAWLHADRSTAYQRSKVSDKHNRQNLKWSKSVLKQVVGKQEKMYNDAFALEIVPREYVLTFNSALGFVPFMQKLKIDFNFSNKFRARKMQRIVSALEEIKEFITVNGIAEKSRQKLLRNFKIVDIIVEILQCPAVKAQAKEFMEKVHRELYDILTAYLEGFSAKNELYVAKHFDFFQTQLSEQAVGLNATNMLMELLKDNRIIINFVTRDQIDMFIKLIVKRKNYKYLELLSVLCIASEETLPENQAYIAKRWLVDAGANGENVVNYVSMGSEIGNMDQQDIPYISTDMKKTWIPLIDFVRLRNGVTEEEVNFFQYQLKLFSYLCRGRIDYPVEVLNKTKGLMSFDVAFYCLQHNIFPDEIRAVCAMNIRDLYIDVGSNHSLMDRVKLVFKFDEFASNATPKNRGSILSSVMPLVFVKPLKTWISEYLQRNTSMISSEIDRNYLNEEVLHLVYSLVNFGYYGDTEEIRKLLHPMLSLMDGRNDKPYPVKNDADLSEAEQAEIQKFRISKRFRASIENTAVSKAKIQAMRVVQLFFNFRFNTRLYNFISVFKTASEGFDELSIFLDEDIDFQETEKYHKLSKKRLFEMYSATDYFDDDFIYILMDLLKYENKQVVTDALLLINKHYSAVERLFKGCIDTQILITKDSKETMKKLETIVPKFKMLKKSMQGGEANPKMVSILKDLARYCSLSNDVRENHPLNQEMLNNYGIVGDTLEIACRYTNPNTKLEKHETDLVRYALRLLKSLARGNDQVQKKLFERIETLMKVEGAEAELGETLMEIFTGNTNNSMKLSSNSIIEFVSLYRANYHPVWLSLLTTLVISERFPIKRNQGLVIKALMTYEETLAIITEKTLEEKIAVLTKEDDAGHSSKHKLCSLVYLFSICAAGENKSIESICQCLIPMEELLVYLNLEKLCNGFKLAFVNFMTTSYLNSSSHTAINETHKCANSEPLIKFLESTVDVLDQGKVIVARDTNLASDLLKLRPSNLHKANGDTMHEMKETLHYIFDGLLPFIHAYMERHWRADMQEISGRVLNALQNFAEVCHPAINRVYQRSQLLHTLRLVAHITGTKVKIPNELMMTNEIPSDSRRIYHSYYYEEIDINEKFDIFAKNLKSAYEGRNTVRTQIGYGTDKMYIDYFNDQPLPLGEEFQKLINCFQEKTGNKKEKRYDISGIIKHLSSSMTFSTVDESMRGDLEVLDIKCFKILRGILHNEFCRLPSSVSTDPKQYKKIMKEVINQQNALDEQGIISAAIPHLARSGNETLVNETFSLLNTLYKNNKYTPESFVKHINDEHDEAFFIAVQNRLQTATSFIKEQKYMVHLYLRAKMQNQTLLKAAKAGGRDSRRSKSDMISMSFDKGRHAVSKLKNLLTVKPVDDTKQELLPMMRKKSVQLQREQENDELDNPNLSMSQNGQPVFKIHSVDETKVPPLILSGKDDDQTDGPDNEDSNDDEKMAIVAFQDINNVTVVLRTLQSLCDLEFHDAQQLMREQNRNVKTVNLVAEVCRFLSLIYTNIDEQYIDLVADVLDTIIETIQGNLENQAVVFDNKVIDFINHILRVETFQGCSDAQILRLKSSIAFLLKLITEENQSPRGQMCQSKMIMGAVSKESIWQTAVEVHELVTMEGLSKEQKQQFTDLGFDYFCLVKRAGDMKLFSKQTEKEMQSHPAWNFYNAKVWSLECLKEDILQRVHFRVTDQEALRGDVEEMLKWEVDRSSHGNKMRDFMAWIKDIHDDILYQRKIHSHTVGKFMVRHWREFNFGIMFLTLMMNIGILVLWSQDVHRETDFEDYWLYHHPNIDVVWHVFGAIHTLGSFCLLISYFLSNLSGFASSKRTLTASMKNSIKMLNRLVLLSSQIEPNARSSKLEVSLIGVQTTYYLIFFAFSLCGTIISPAFFAFHLLQIVEFSQLLTRVIRAVTVNGKSLLWVALLGLIIIYIYGLIAFISLREIIQANAHLCNSLWQCSATMMREGLIYRTMRLDYPLKGSYANTTHLQDHEIYENDDFGFYSWKLVFDLSFFIIILTIGLNVIFGIIVDTFRQLRDSKWRIEQDMETTCFSFKYHLNYEHNMLAYIFFYVRLQDKPQEDYSHLEMYIYKMVSTENYNFFPLNHAMSLDALDEQEAAVERDLIMMKQLDLIMKKLNYEESERVKEAERLRQLEWQRQNQQSLIGHKSRVDFDSSGCSDNSVLSRATASSAPSSLNDSPKRKLTTASTIKSKKSNASFKPLKGYRRSPKNK